VKRDLRAAAVVVVECLLHAGRFEAWRTSEHFYKVLHEGDNFHPFTKLKVLLYGLIAFGHIPDRVD
jgi:hypothetical protein